MSDLPPLISADPAPIIIAIATLVTAIAGAIVVVVNAFRSKRIEQKVDAGSQIQGQIHSAVNGQLADALSQVASLTSEVQQLKTLLLPGTK